MSKKKHHGAHHRPEHRGSHTGPAHHEEMHQQQVPGGHDPHMDPTFKQNNKAHGLGMSPQGCYDDDDGCTGLTGGNQEYD